MFTKIKEVLQDLYHYKTVYLVRTFSLQFILMIVASFGLSELFNLILVFGSQANLTKNNILNFVLNPFSFLMLILYIFCLVFFVYIEFFFLVTILQKKSDRLKLNIDFWKNAWVRFWKITKGRQFIYFFLYMVLTIPVSGVFLTSSLFQKIYIPYFITDELTKSPMSAALVGVVFLILIYLNFRFVYTLPLLAVQENQTFSQQIAKSWKLTKGKLFKTLWNLILLIFPILFLIGIFLIILVLFFIVLESTSPSILTQGILLILLNGFLFALLELSKLGFVSYLLNQLGELHVSKQPKISGHRRVRAIVFGVLFLLLIGSIRVIGNFEKLTYNPYNNAILTIAHRGTVKTGVENSLEALEGAAKANVDYVEMDILLTADNQFVVIHDNNLNRLAGINKKVSEMTLAELEGLTISQGDFTSTLPSFDTYVAKAKELGVKLLVELKPHGGEPDNYIQLVIDKLKELQVDTTYKLMSLDLSVMEKIEQMAPEIETGYVIPLQLGNLAGEHVDFLVLEDFSYRDRLVWEAKLKKQDLYVWTINREDQMERYLQSSVAGMITDYPDLLQQVKDNFTTHNGYLERFLRLLGQ